MKTEASLGLIGGAMDWAVFVSDGEDGLFGCLVVVLMAWGSSFGVVDGSLVVSMAWGRWFSGCYHSKKDSTSGYVLLEYHRKIF